jgi:signal transduction histidine kinase
LINTLKNGTKKYGYLLLIAAWLFTVSLIVTKYKSYTYTPEKVQQQLSNTIIEKEKKFIALTSDTTVLREIVDKNSTGSEKLSLTDYPFGILLYSSTDVENPTPIYWNSNKYSVTDEDLQKKDGHYFVTYQNGNFELLKKTILINNSQIICIGIIPIRWHYFIENKYLKTSFVDLKELDNFYEISNTNTGFAIKNINNQELFRIQKKIGFIYQGYDWLTLILRTIAIFFLLVYINYLAVEIVKQKSFNKGFYFLMVTIFFLRLSSYIFPFPFDFNELPLFDPSIYASSFIHPSLGSLLINSILIFWVITFYKFSIKKETKEETRQHKNNFLPYVHLFILTAITIFLVSIVRSLVLDSKISFDVSNFFSLTIYSVISFVILCFCVLIFYHLSHILLKLVFAKRISLTIQLFVVAIFGLLFLSFNIGKAFVSSNLFAIVWLMLYITCINFRKKDIELSILKSSFFIFWTMFFAFSVAVLVMYQNNYTELEQRKKWAEKLAEQTDLESEALLKIASTNFSDQFLTQNFNRFGQEFSNKFIKDSLISENFSGYLNKYDTRIYIFDSLHKPLYNDDSLSYAVIKTIILNQGNATSIPDLYSYNSINQKKGYLYERKIIVNSLIKGYLFVTVKPKRYKSEALYPELFRQVQDLNSDFNTNYAYAIYSNGKLVNRFNDYNFPSSLIKKTLPIVKFEQHTSNEYNELWYNTGSGKIVIIAKKKSLTIELVTLFAYLFCTFLIVITLFHAGNFILKTGFRRKENFKQIFQFNIRTQIHTTIIFISIFSFIVIGAATISFFIFRFNQANEDRLSKSIQVMANEIEERVKVVRSQLEFDDVLNINDVGFGPDLEKKINEISEVHNVDVNFYTATGNLAASTQPYIYNKHLLNDKMDPTAFFELKDNKSIRFIQSEKIAGFPFLSIYVPVTDDAGNTYAYLNIPYLNSQAELNQEISGFLATLINLNAFIFLLAGAIAYLATERITASFSLISEKMKAVNLGKHNEAIEWNRNDEIGILVNEYNKMVQKLEQSAEALAQSEREGAWREMARQVAHEIKNPLTPMKLSIQYLQKSLDNNNINVKQLTNQVATTLVEQIEQLSKIAGDFSQFANIGNVKLEKVDVANIIANLVQLHSAQEKVTIHWIKENINSFINADKVQISRLFSNLLLNAIEACENNKQAIITIEQKNGPSTVEISITDNGYGIEETMKDKIFTPNFTTKSSGTGLGLAICKGIAEKANGSIHFITEKNKGTTFIVVLPLVTT